MSTRLNLGTCRLVDVAQQGDELSMQLLEPGMRDQIEAGRHKLHIVFPPAFVVNDASDRHGIVRNSRLGTYQCKGINGFTISVRSVAPFVGADVDGEDIFLLVFMAGNLYATVERVGELRVEMHIYEVAATGDGQAVNGFDIDESLYLPPMGVPR